MLNLVLKRVLFLLILSYALDAKNLNLQAFYQQVHTQSLENNFVQFRKRILISREAYHTLTPKEKEFLNQNYVLVFGKIDAFIRFNEQSGIGIAIANASLFNSTTPPKSYLQFDIRYYETLKDIGVGGAVYAMCVLPYFDKCVLLGH